MQSTEAISPYDVDSLVPAGLQPPNKTNDLSQITPNYTKLSESLRRVTPSEFQCSVFCGGKRCKYETPDNWTPEQMAIQGIYSHWVTDDILAMARPNTECITNVIEQFQSLNIRSLINLQRSGEHASCGGTELEVSGFSYDPDVFMQSGIYCYNFAWEDYGEATLTSILDMVKVMAFALTQGKVAVHCHAGLGRTGVLLSCYLVYTLRVRANDAIRFVRLKRPNAVQTRGQILCVQEFEQFILPNCLVFCNKDFVKNKKLQEFTLIQYMNRQRLILHGYEARVFKHIPKLLFAICERLLRLCNCHNEKMIPQSERNGRSVSSLTIRYEVSPIPFTRHFVSSRMDDSQVFRPNIESPLFTPLGSHASSAFSTRSPSTDLESSMNFEGENGMKDDDGSDSPDTPSCASGMTGLDDKTLDSLLADGIRNQQLNDNMCYQELSSQKDLKLTDDPELAPPYRVDEVAKALLSDHNLLSEGLMRCIRQYRLELNHRPVSWGRLNLEKNLYVLCGLLFTWLEHLKSPIITTEDLSVIVVMATSPEKCLRKFDKDIRYTLEYLVRFLSRLKPLAVETQRDLMKRIVGAICHRSVVIQGVLTPSERHTKDSEKGEKNKKDGSQGAAARTFRKLREGTLSRLMEFTERLMELVVAGDDSSWAPSGPKPHMGTSSELQARPPGEMRTPTATNSGVQ